MICDRSCVSTILSKIVALYAVLLISYAVLLTIMLGTFIIILGAFRILLGASIIILGASNIILGAFIIILGAFSILLSALITILGAFSIIMQILRDPYRRAPSSAKITTLSLKHLFQTFSRKKRVNLHKYHDVQTQYEQHDIFGAKDLLKPIRPWVLNYHLPE